MSFRTKVALAAALVFGSASAVLAGSDEGKVVHAIGDQGLVVRRALPVRLFEGRDAGPNERFLKCVTEDAFGRIGPCNGHG
jgi:hypothetical protein